MTNWTDEELARLLKGGNVELVTDHVERVGNALITSGYIIGKDQPKHPAVKPAKNEALVVPKEYSTHATVFKSNTERDSLHYLVDTYAPTLLLYEPLMFRLPSGSYTPDWMMVHEERIFFYEVKGAGGFKAYKSGRSSQKSLKELAFHMGWLGTAMLLIKQKGGVWHEESV